MNKIIVIIFLGFFSNVLNAQTNYLCITEKSSGFNYSKSRKNWDSVQFNNRGKYVIKNSSTDWDVRKMGEQTSMLMTCTKSKPNTIVYCNSVAEHFTFNPVELKFSYYFAGGYSLPAVFPDPLVIEIGLCSPL